MRLLMGLLVGVPVALIAVACGSSENSEFDPTKNTPKSDGSAPTFGDSGVPATKFARENACVTAESRAKILTGNLVVALDISGSMKLADQGGNPAKWGAVKDGFRAMVTDTRSRSMNMAVTFFPPVNHFDIADACKANYNADIPLQAVEDGAKIMSVIDGVDPSGGTPTGPALVGVAAQANAIKAQNPNEKTVEVLVTDGEPGFRLCGDGSFPTSDGTCASGSYSFGPGCNQVSGTKDPNTLASVQALASSANASGIPLYVIGVGTSLSNLNAIAAAGGTGSAFIITPTDATTVASQLQAKLTEIRRTTARCDIPVPADPAGKQIDLTRVNVILVDGSNEKVIEYSTSCATDGWQYSADRKSIILCKTTCDALKSQDVDVVVALGCVNPAIPPN